MSNSAEDVYDPLEGGRTLYCHDAVFQRSGSDIARIVFMLIFLLLLAACGAPSTVSTPASTSVSIAASTSVSTEATIRVEPSSIPATRSSTTEVNAVFWEAIGCTKEVSCTPVTAERVTNNEPERWCVVVIGGAGPVARTFLRTGDAWKEALAVRSTFEQLGCTQAVAELDGVTTAATAAAVAAAPPTATPLAATQIIGEPLPKGTLEASECYPSRGCVAVVTEKSAAKDYLWCVVLDQEGGRHAWTFLKNGENDVPSALEATTESFEREGCTSAAAAMKAGQ